MEAARGKRLLDEVEEMSLKEVLDSLRLALPSEATTPSVRTKPTHIPDLDAVAARHYRDTQAATLALKGRSLPLVYKLVSTLVSAPWRYAVLVVDVDGCFDASGLTCVEDEDLAHVYIQRAAEDVYDDDDDDGDDDDDDDDDDDNADAVRDLVVAAQRFMLYHAVASASRHWWGTVVVGGSASGGLAGLVDVVTGWKGWLHVERETVPPFPPGLNLDEALARREARQRAVDAAGWTATSPWGGFIFHQG